MRAVKFSTTTSQTFTSSNNNSAPLGSLRLRPMLILPGLTSAKPAPAFTPTRVGMSDSPRRTRSRSSPTGMPPKLRIVS